MPNRLIKKAPDWYQAFIQNLVTGQVIYLPFSPDTISETISTNVEEQDIIGSSVPVITYASTGARNVSFQVLVTDEIVVVGKQSINSPTDIISYVNALKSCLYPVYDKSKNTVKAPSCFVVLGSLKLTGICTAVNVNWSGPDMNNGLSGTKQRCTVDMTFLEVKDSAMGAIEIRDGSY